MRDTDMEHKKQIQLTCPYCRTKFWRYVPLRAYYTPYVVFCECEDQPGCGEPFVIKPEVSITVIAYALAENKMTEE